MEHLKDYDMKTLHEWKDGELRTTELHFYQAFLINKLGLTDTRASDFAKGVEQLHLALSRCDWGNLSKLAKAYPGICTLVNDFARLEELKIQTNSKGEEYK